MTDEDQEVRALLAAGMKIKAVARYREIHQVGLKEAKDAVDAMAPGREPPTSAAGDLAWPDPEIDNLIQAGQKIQAIKRYREGRDVGLKEAKDLIDARAVELGVPAGRAGCFVATAAYGPGAPEVAVLRRYRDRVLRRSRPGRAFTRYYYHASPPLAAALRRTATGRAAARWLMRPVVSCCRRIVGTGSHPR